MTKLADVLTIKDGEIVPRRQTILVCNYCNEEIQRVGEDALNWCENCQCVEGPVREITKEEYEEIHG